MSLLIKNIKGLLQVNRAGIKKVEGSDMKNLPQISDAWLLVKNGIIDSFGSMSEMPNFDSKNVIDAQGKFVLPCWIDSHTHIVYAGNREGEFVDRINGLSYEEIASKGGGILNSAEKLRNTSENELFQSASKRLFEMIQLGTGAVEIKSGYGLSVDAELKMLRVIRKLKDHFSIPVKATFLGAHALPKEYKDRKKEYLDLIINEMMPQIEAEGLADYVDIFCEKGYFDLEDTERILSAGTKHGMIPKTHVNQFHSIGGVQKSIDHRALSVDHLEVLNKEDLQSLKGSQTMPVALPGCSLFLSIPYTPAREIIDSGLPLALATDFNPGSAPSGNMNLVVSLACIKMNMTPEEAINAATLNGAYALGLEEELGSIDKGKRANLIITKEIPSYGYLPYSFGENCIERVLIDGYDFD